MDTVSSALESISSQTYQNLHSIIIDGASTDGTLELIDKFKIENSFVLSEPDDGIYHALNKGLLICKTDIVGFLHSDDEISNSSVISDVVECFESGADVVYGDIIFFDKDNRVCRRWVSGQLGNFKYGWMPPHPTVFIRSAMLKEIGYFNTNYSVSADYDHILRIFSKKDLSVRYIARPLVHMKAGGASNGSIKKFVKHFIEDLKVSMNNPITRLYTPFFKVLRKLKQFR